MPMSHVVIIIEPHGRGVPEAILNDRSPRPGEVSPSAGPPKQHSIWAPVGPQLGKVGPGMGPGWARLGPILECCLGSPHKDRLQAAHHGAVATGLGQLS